MTYIVGRQPDEPVLAEAIAEKTGLSSHDLSRILRDAVYKDLLEWERGVGGGRSLFAAG